MLEVKSVKMLDIKETKPMTTFIHSNICLMHFYPERSATQYYCGAIGLQRRF